MATVTTYCQAGFQPYETCTQQPHTCTQTFPHTDYLLSGKATYCQAKLPTVRQSYLLSGMHPNVAAYFAPNNRIFPQVAIFRKKVENLHVLKKSNIVCFLKKSKKLTPTLLRCAHIQKNRLFELLHIPDPRKSVLGPGDVSACCLVQELTDLFTILRIFYKFALMLHES